MQSKPTLHALAEMGIALVAIALMLAGCGGSPFSQTSGGEPTAFGGAVTGLAAGNVAVLQLQHPGFAVSGTVSTNTPFTIEQTQMGSPLLYSLTVASQPAGQSCSVARGSGWASPGTGVSNMLVDCSGNTYNVAVTVSGLIAYSSLTLQNNGGDDLESFSNDIPSNFNTPLAGGSAYAVTVLSQPQGQTCSVANGRGVVNGANVIVRVTCT